MKISSRLKFKFRLHFPTPKKLTNKSSKQLKYIYLFKTGPLSCENDHKDILIRGRAEKFDLHNKCQNINFFCFCLRIHSLSRTFQYSQHMQLINMILSDPIMWIYILRKFSKTGISEVK